MEQLDWLKRKLAHAHEALRTARRLDRSTVLYDRQTVEVMRRVLGRESNGIDIGAHKGGILRHMVEIAPRGAHHAFEALPHLAAQLRKRFPQVRVHPVAVSNASGRAAFQHVENDPGYSGLRRRIYDHPTPRVATIQVTAVTLDEVLSPDQPVAFMKIDIEGGEYHALQGAVSTIRRSRPVIVFEAGRKSTGEYGVTPDELYELITESFGYDLSTMRRWLDERPPLAPDEFRANWDWGPDYYFIATPAAS